MAALQDAGVRILIQAYPDELDKMGVGAARRLLRQVLHHGRVLPVRDSVHGAPAARRPIRHSGAFAATST